MNFFFFLALKHEYPARRTLRHSNKHMVRFLRADQRTHKLFSHSPHRKQRQGDKRKTKGELINTNEPFCVCVDAHLHFFLRVYAFCVCTFFAYILVRLSPSCTVYTTLSLQYCPYHFVLHKHQVVSLGPGFPVSAYCKENIHLILLEAHYLAASSMDIFLQILAMLRPENVGLQVALVVWSSVAFHAG